MSNRAKRKSEQIVVCPISGRRLCRDYKWRSFASFGTYPECVKVYRYPKAAMNAGIRHRIKPAKSGDTLATIIYLYDGDSMDAAGNVTRKNDNLNINKESVKAKMQPKPIAYQKELKFDQ